MNKKYLRNSKRNNIRTQQRCERKVIVYIQLETDATELHSVVGRLGLKSEKVKE